jgi:hypothetical protein
LMMVFGCPSNSRFLTTYRGIGLRTPLLHVFSGGVSSSRSAIVNGKSRLDLAITCTDRIHVDQVNMAVVIQSCVFRRFPGRMITKVKRKSVGKSTRKGKSTTTAPTTTHISLAKEDMDIDDCPNSDSDDDGDMLSTSKRGKRSSSSSKTASKSSDDPDRMIKILIANLNYALNHYKFCALPGKDCIRSPLVSGYRYVDNNNTSGRTDIDNSCSISNYFYAKGLLAVARADETQDNRVRPQISYGDITRWRRPNSNY